MQIEHLEKVGEILAKVGNYLKLPREYRFKDTNLYSPGTIEIFTCTRIDLRGFMQMFQRVR